MSLGMRAGIPTSLLLLCLAASASGQDIVVRAINGKNGKPFIGIPANLYAKDSDLYPKDYVKLLATADTGAAGSAVFHLRNPLPKQVFVTVGESARIFDCSTHLTFLADEVLRSGVVSDNRCERTQRVRDKFAAKPGEIIVFVRPLTEWDRFWREL